MYLRFVTIQGKRVSLRCTRAQYEELLERFTVGGLSEEMECAFCVGVRRDTWGTLACSVCRLSKAAGGYCEDTVIGLENILQRRCSADIKKFRRAIQRAAKRGPWGKIKKGGRK